MKKYVIIKMALVLLKVNAQQIEYCGYDSIISSLKKANPAAVAAWDNDYLNILRGMKMSRRGLKIDTTYYYNTDTIYTIPVVVHVVYDTNNLKKKLSPALVQSQIDVLNTAFMHSHADTGKVINVFKSRAKSVGIQFVLASIDPNGNPTSGIEYINSTVTTFGQKRNDVKYSSRGGADAWDASKYLNIWTCDLSVNGIEALYGFATPPIGHEFWIGTGTTYPDAEQGAVINYRVFGRNNPNALTLTGRPVSGRTTVHEIGHYLGMRHIWGDGGNTSGCFVDDYIDDTPNQRTNSNFTCQTTRNTCTDASNDLPDNVQNYMDYSSDDCSIMFTKEQATVMRYTLLAFRSGVVAGRRVDSTLVARYDSLFYADKPTVSQDNNGKVTLHIPLDKVNKYTFDVVNMAGQIVTKTQLLTAPNVAPDLSKLAFGVYIIRLFDENEKTIDCFKVFGQ